MADRCSFCNRTSLETAILFANNGCKICELCVSDAVAVMTSDLRRARGIIDPTPTGEGDE